MVKKLREMASKDTDDATLMNSVCQSAHQIWQAGLGAFAMAQGQGEALFGKLVERGASVQKRIESSTGQALPAPAAGSTAGSWEKLEKVFEDRVGRALHGLGVPSQEDIRALGRQIDALNQAISRLPVNTVAAPKARAKRIAPPARAKTTSSQPAATTVRPASRKKPASAPAA